MPELPEVETTRRGITPHCLGQRITAVTVRQAQLRWPVPRGLNQRLCGQTIRRIERRAKYLLLGFDNGSLILHLGMSGSLRIIEASLPAAKHDHLDIALASGKALRLTDPRRFGAVLWSKEAPQQHALLRTLGPEPLSEAFNTDTLFAQSRGRRIAIKSLIMDGHIVVGVGNIYACESLFLAGIHPKTAAGKISRARYARLVEAIKQVLAAAIEQGGTTLRDFVGSDGRPGYFAQSLQVYGRAGEPCGLCKHPIKQIQQGQRSTFYCAHCQR